MKTRAPRPALVVAIALANWVTALVVGALHLPFFIDSWATSAGVLASGLGVGIAGGVLYNLLMAATVWGGRASVWAASSVLIACATWTFQRARWIDIERPLRLVAAGVLTGLANAGLAIVLVHSVLGIPDDVNTRAFRHSLAGLLGDTPAVLIVQEVLTEIADKTISLITAAAVVVLLFERAPAPPARRA